MPAHFDAGTLAGRNGVGIAPTRAQGALHTVVLDGRRENVALERLWHLRSNALLQPRHVILPRE